MKTRIRIARRSYIVGQDLDLEPFEKVQDVLWHSPTEATVTILATVVELSRSELDHPAWSGGPVDPGRVWLATVAGDTPPGPAIKPFDPTYGGDFDHHQDADQAGAGHETAVVEVLDDGGEVAETIVELPAAPPAGLLRVEVPMTAWYFLTENAPAFRGILDQGTATRRRVGRGFQEVLELPRPAMDRLGALVVETLLAQNPEAKVREALELTQKRITKALEA